MLKKTVKNVAVFLCLLSMSSLSYAQKLWQDTTYGMSYAAVQQQYPQVAKPAHPETLSNGSQGLLQLNNINISNIVFYATFYFKNKTLTQVTLALDEAHPYNQTLTVFETLTTALQKKYGKELHHDEKNGLLQEATSVWLAQGTQIELHVMGAGNNNALLTLSYQAAPSSFVK